MTVPLAPNDGSGRPFSSKLTPPAFPMVITNGRLDTHSRTAPAGTVSSLVRPSSVRTRIHVGSLTRATSRYGVDTPVVAVCTCGIHGRGPLGATGGTAAIGGTGAGTGGAPGAADRVGSGGRAGGDFDAGGGIGRVSGAGVMAATGGAEAPGRGLGGMRSTRCSRAGCVTSATAKSATPSTTSRTKLTRMALRVRGSLSVGEVEAATAPRGGGAATPSRTSRPS